MLHELLFALRGQQGSIIKLTSEAMRVETSHTSFQQPNIETINRLLKLGFYYHQITSFVDNANKDVKETEEEEANKGVYLKALCSGVTEVLEEYQNIILKIEERFLENRSFTYGELFSDLTDYFLLFPELFILLSKIQEDRLRGGMILQLLYHKYISSSSLISSSYKLLFSKCYSVMYKQLVSWIIYGKLVDFHSEFFIHKIQHENSDKVGKDWDSMYTLEVNMIPKSIVDGLTAEKILFIGKGTLVLRVINKELSRLPDERLVLRVMELKEYNSYSFNQVIEDIRHNVAHELIELIMRRENLLKELETLQEYYLMAKGDFFYAFMEEAQSILSMPYSKKSEHSLNTVALPNTFFKIGEEANEKVSLQASQNGFRFNNFGSTTNLTILGNVQIRSNNYLKFKPVRSFGNCMWHNIKQPIQNGFSMKMCFRFKKAVHSFSASINATLPSSRIKAEQVSSTSLCFVIQNSNQISSWKKNAPIGLQEMKEYFCVKVGMEESLRKTHETKSFLIVSSYGNESDTEKMLGRLEFKKNEKKGDSNVDFVEEDFHQITVKYENGDLKISLGETRNDNSDMRLSVNLGKILHLDMGRGYMGFVQSSFNSSYSVDIISWELVGKNALNIADYWGDLTVKYSIEWPLSLILSNQLIEKYEQLFRMFFPIRGIQIQLDNEWVHLQKSIRNNREISHDSILNICGVRNELSTSINALWVYFQNDVVKYQWDKLKENLKSVDDFYNMRMYLDSYITSIERMCFLTSPNILKSIFEIVKVSKSFVEQCRRLESEENCESSIKALVEVKMRFRESLRVLIKQLNNLSNITSSEHISELLTKLDFNEFYSGDPSMVF